LAGIETEELLQDIEHALKMIELMEQIDDRTAKIKRSPIRLPVGFHVGVIAIAFAALGAGFLLDQVGFFVDYRFFVTIDNLWIYLGIPLIGYPLLILMINLYVRFAKKWLYRDELEKLSINKMLYVEKLQKVSRIPQDYWTSVNLIRMKRYILTKRAENLKEALNLLEDELRANYFMEQFGIEPFREINKKRT
jgi:hypothetical protein